MIWREEPSVRDRLDLPILQDLLDSGATSVLDEETGVGLQVASEILTALDAMVSQS